MGEWKPSQQHKHFVDDFPGGRRGAPRCEAQLNVVISFSATLHASQDSTRPPSQSVMRGETRNLSETGLAVSVASNHIGDRYFNVIGCMLEVSLDLEDGRVQMLASPAWCQWFVEEREVRSYGIGLRIAEMSDEEWVRLVRYVHARL